MTAQMKAILDGLKKREKRRKLPTVLPAKQIRLSHYEEGVKIASPNNA